MSRIRRNGAVGMRGTEAAGLSGPSSFSWPALIAAGAVLAALGALVFQGQEFTALPGICTIVGCLVVNQYVLAIRPKR
jgi:hypothetical protein